MSSSPEFVAYVVDQMAAAGVVTSRKMFGEYGVYCDGKIVALICDDQLFIKPTEAAREIIGAPVEAPPYPGAKNYYLLEGQVDDADWLGALVQASVKELPEPRKKKPRKK